MPVLHGVLSTTLESPVRRNRLSLRFLQKKETKRALDFTEPQPEEPEEPKSAEAAEVTSCDQVVPTPCPSPTPCERRESLVPFVGLNNLGNTCYLNSVLQVLYYCPGFKDAIKSLYHLSKVKDRQKDDAQADEGDSCKDSVPVHTELLHSFYSLISSVEQLQSSFLFNPDKYSDGELATPPRRVLNTLRQLNPMYEGYLQHDAQEVLQCILAYIQEACDAIRRDLSGPGPEEQLGGKRKSDTEAGNAKKKTKSQSKPRQGEDERRPLTRSKTRSSGDLPSHGVQGDEEEEEEEGGRSNAEEELKGNSRSTFRSKLKWLKASGKQPSILFKFRSMGRTGAGHKGEPAGPGKPPAESEETPPGPTTAKTEDVPDLDALKRLFQGQLVLRTRCLECEGCTERREDFQDISVPVHEDEPGGIDSTSEISPNPKPEQKTLRWALSQFASVERIVGEDKYFCETCRHYTEAERSLLFHKTPDVVTIHLKCFSASGSEMDPYAGLSKVNTPLHTPLQLSLREWSAEPPPPHPENHYRLFGVVMHSGVTISSGHYTAYVRVLRRARLTPDPTATPRDLPFSPGASRPAPKRPSEGVALLGGQRSLATGREATTPARKSRETGEGETRAEAGPRDLLEYQGKWMLFDDSEVRLVEEEEFLRACSPESCSTSTPYLLFYERVAGGMD